MFVYKFLRDLNYLHMYHRYNVVKFLWCNRQFIRNLHLHHIQQSRKGRIHFYNLKCWAKKPCSYPPSHHVELICLGKPSQFLLFNTFAAECRCQISLYWHKCLILIVFSMNTSRIPSNDPSRSSTVETPL